METKICRHCAETMRQAARVCPFCAQSQGWRFVKVEILQTVVICVLLSITFFVCVQLIVGKRDFSKYRGQLVVLNSSLLTITNEAHPRPTLIGTVTNRSSFAWESLVFEVRCFDEHGRLIDSESPYGNFAMPPRSERAFSLELWRLKPIIPHSSYAVIVRDARDPGKFW